jgi:AbrB family looped-hinge helix DNA binding protein
MAKVTNELQITIPKAIADQYGIRPGDEVEWASAEDGIRVIPANGQRHSQLRPIEERLQLFREMLERQRQREASPLEDEVEACSERPPKPYEVARGWRREDLYTRGSSR